MSTKLNTVFEDGQWTLVTGRAGVIPGDTIKQPVSIKHACNQIQGNQYNTHEPVRSVFVFDHDSRHCWKCSQLIPEGIIGLLRMYNWDK